MRADYRWPPGMALVKTAVDLATLSDGQIQRAVAAYGLALVSSTKLHNGYSGCNYRCEVRPLHTPAQGGGGGTAGEAGAGTTAVLLKGSADKGVGELAVQLEVLRALRANGYPTACGATERPFS